MITSLLIANRGEIACRIIRTARAMGIRTVAVYSDADAKALHVRQADEAVHIGPSPARESYLVGDKIIAAAKATGAEAIHPGYGFLSENAAFAQAVIDAGLVWVGPNPASITAMGLKDHAKTLMSAAGVPVTPGYIGDDQSPKRLAKEAAAIGFPVLIKAVAGGGGKGMRRVDAAADFADALDSCRREAASSFGNDVVLLEKYILSPRHIEVQVFGDSHGNVVHLFERDCSLQRRHQKVIEEAPAPGMDAATREQLCGAAIRAAKAVDYVGAGTIEFIADASDGLRADRIWFMEMNTRLQVEHPVTEEITGVDLVEWQLRVASGEALPLKQDELAINGHAIEARLYAEDPAKGFLPSVGRLRHFKIDPDQIMIVQYAEDLVRGSFRGNDIGWTPPPVLRIETGVEEGDDVSAFYDPMIAKLIVHSETRLGALNRLAEACEAVEVWPVHTNASFLARLLRHSNIAVADITTGFIAKHSAKLTMYSVLPPICLSVGLGLLTNDVASLTQSSAPAPLAGLRLNSPAKTTSTLLVDGSPAEATPGPELQEHMAPAFFGGYFTDGEQVVLFQKGAAHSLSLARRGSVGAAAGDGAILAPMPGKVTIVEVAAGDAVTKGQRLLTLEAMKMEHGLVAPFDGVVAELNTSQGAQVQVDAVLARIEKNDDK